MLNIILNAVHACSEGGRVELAVERAGAGTAVEFIVEDTGPGISEDVKGRLFEPFFTTKNTGTGLGLSNAQKIVASHGGSISVENRPDRGARFVIRLPVETSGVKEV